MREVEQIAEGIVDGEAAQVVRPPGRLAGEAPEVQQQASGAHTKEVGQVQGGGEAARDQRRAPVPLHLMTGQQVLLGGHGRAVRLV